MVFVISFPNFVCLLLTGALVVHMFTRDPSMDSFPEPLDHLEVAYCRLPQSHSPEDTRHCTSTQSLFVLLGNDCSLEKKRKIVQEVLQNETGSESGDGAVEDAIEDVVTVEVDADVVEREKEKQEEEMTSSLVDSFVISLLVCSAIVSLLEWFKERAKQPEKGAIGDSTSATGGGEASSDRRISLADLTVNRHIRRQDSQQLETIKHNFASGSKPPPLIRRSSFPAQFPEARSRHAPQRQQSTPGTPSLRRMSIDLSEDESPDRRRVRIIRRH